jgi:hypothetical protein
LLRSWFVVILGIPLPCYLYDLTDGRVVQVEVFRDGSEAVAVLDMGWS